MTDGALAAGGVLAAYGLTPEVVAALRAGADASANDVPSLDDGLDVRLGRIVRVDRGECTVVTEQGLVRALSDSHRAQGEVAPATGDWVRLTDVGDLRPVVTGVAPRANTLVRRDPSEAVVDQVLVANVDVVMIVHGLDRSLPPGRLERFLVLAWDSGAQPVVVLTKADLPELVDDTVATVHALAPDVPVELVRRDDPDSLDALRRWFGPGTTTALVGASGAGKSTLVNRLLGHDRLATSAVRDRDSRGRHTTTARELLLVPGGGCVIDTPGIRSVGLWAAEDTLHRAFADLEALAEGCRFADCAHDQEPGCAVQAAVAAGTLDARRVQRFRALVAELAELRERERERARAEGPGGRRGRPKRPPTIDDELDELDEDDDEGDDRWPRRRADR